MVAYGSPQLSSLGWLNISKRMLHIMDVVDFYPEVYALVNVCDKAADVNRPTLIVVISLDDLVFLVLLLGWTREGWLGAFQAQPPSLLHCQARTCMEEHIWSSGGLLITRVKRVWVRLGPHEQYEDSWEKGSEITVVTMREGVTGHLELQSAGFTVLAPRQRGSICSGFLLVHVDEKWDDNITFVTMLLIWHPVVIINGWPVESIEGRIGRGKYLWKNELGKEKMRINGFGKNVGWKRPENTRNHCENAIKLSEKMGEAEYSFYRERLKSIGIRYRWNGANDTVHGTEALNIYTTNARWTVQSKNPNLTSKNSLAKVYEYM